MRSGTPDLQRPDAFLGQPPSFPSAFMSLTKACRSLGFAEKTNGAQWGENISSTAFSASKSVRNGYFFWIAMRLPYFVPRNFPKAVCICLQTGKQGCGSIQLTTRSEWSPKIAHATSLTIYRTCPWSSPDSLCFPLFYNLAGLLDSQDSGLCLGLQNYWMNCERVWTPLMFGYWEVTTKSFLIYIYIYIL